jgi:hypothetical protein
MQDKVMSRDAANCAAPWWRSDDELLALAEDIAKGEFTVMVSKKRHITKHRSRVVNNHDVIAKHKEKMAAKGWVCKKEWNYEGVTSHVNLDYERD